MSKPGAPARAGAAERVTGLQLLWISACLALAVAPRVAILPVWVTLTIATVAALRLTLASRGRDLPPAPLRFVVGALAIGLLLMQFHTFNGLTPGGALLSLIAGLKLMETRTQRDIQVLSMIIYFLCLATLLEAESFWLLAYLIGVCWLTTATLLRFDVTEASDWRGSLRYAGRLLAQALPVAAAFWLFFPRLGGPLWQLPDDGGSASTGLGDSMSPGDITELAMSEEVAFRVHFVGDAPPPEERYWRGPVLHDFDGRAWRRSDAGPVRASPLQFSGPEYRYTVSLEPSPHNWLFVLDWPAQWNAPRAMLTSDYMLVTPNSVAQPIDLTAASYGQARATVPLDAALRNRDTWLPPDSNPRTRRLAEELHALHPEPSAFVQAVIDMFHQQPFYYTLTPPPLARNSVDAFLFDSRRGFCGHYASALAAMVRAAGIPARVVTGYQGGTYNRFAGYWIVRQSDAHAWDEVWIDGQGWIRVDPTAAIPPDRVEHGLNEIVRAGAPSTSRWEQRSPWFTDARLRLDALRLLWRERILEFDQNSQDRLLQWLHVPEPDGQKLALVLAACLIAGMSWQTWQVRHEMRVRPESAVDKAFGRLCSKLAAEGFTRRPHEGAEAFGARVAAERPELARPALALCRQYSALRYEAAGGAPQGRAVAKFVAAVRAFRPRDFRASS